MDFKVSRNLPPILSKNDWVAIDLELFGAEKKKLHRPNTGVFACLSFCAESNPDIVYVITDETQVKQALENVKDAIWIFHNAGFDLTHLRRWAEVKPRKKIWDVMILERIMCGGLYDGDQFSLEDVVRRRLDLRMNKKIRETFEKPAIHRKLIYDEAQNDFGLTDPYSILDDEQLKYAANDAYVTLLACKAQRKELTPNNYKVWTEVDRGALWAILDFKGFRLDVEAWKTLAESNIARAEELKSGLPFNPASPKQVKEALSSNGFKRLKDTNEKTLNNMMQKYPDVPATELAKQVLDYRMYAKRASTYGTNFIDNFVETEDDVPVIHAGYWVVGTEHGRTSSSNPNMQNIIARDTKDFRKCFIARPGNKLVIIDMGQQETRIAAFLSQDKALIKILMDKEQDVFVGMAKMIYKKDIDKSHPFRKQVKNTVYGIFYGITPEGMNERYDMSEEDAEIAIDKFFATFPDVYSWITQQQKKRNYVETIIGRRVWLNPYSDQVERNAVNAPISGSAADQMKIALGRIHREWAFDYPFACVGYIHDEVIFDVPESIAEDVAQFVSKIMIEVAEAQCPGVPFNASYVVGDNWSEKE